MCDYDPDDAAVPQDPWDTVRLSTRDVSGQIPIDRLSLPSVSLTAACFSNDAGTKAAAAGTKAVYDLQRSKKCLANLIANGYRRFTIDVYWSGDPGFERGWGLCPMAIPSPKAQALSDSANITSGSSSTSGGGGGGGSPSITSTSAPSTQHSKKASSSSHLQLDNYSCSPDLGIVDILRVFADYFLQTQDTLRAQLLYAIVNVHLAKPPSHSDNKRRSAPPASSVPAPTTTASTATSSSHPTPSDGDSDTLPSQKELLGSFFQTQVGQYMYTPGMLKSERANLNRSWFALARPPIAEYMSISDDGSSPSDARDAPVSTKDGWPCETYLAFTLAKRFLVAWGHVDEDMKDYDFAGETGYFFPRGSLSKEANTAVGEGSNRSSGGGGGDGNEKITSGCLFNQKSTEVDTSDKSSWIESTNVTAQARGGGGGGGGSNTFSPSLVSRLVDCGLSPSVNHPISDSSADRNSSAYLALVKDATWSWAPGEPVNSDPVMKTDNARCATLDVKSGKSGSSNTNAAAGNNNKSKSKNNNNNNNNNKSNDNDDNSKDSNSYSSNHSKNNQNNAQRADNKNIYRANGRWRASDCSRRLFGACRVGNEPYRWTLSGKRSRYGDVVANCPRGSSFAVPRTALENRYLYAFLTGEAARDKNSDYDGSEPVWMDFNSLQVERCWVSGGAGAKCPYRVRAADTNRRNVIVPTVAVIIILVLTGATLLIKCHENRRKQRRNRIIKGWDYEGVPS